MAASGKVEGGARLTVEGELRCNGSAMMRIAAAAVVVLLFALGAP
jgi:hypothetical protein